MIWSPTGAERRDRREFTGLRPELCDAAKLAGCTGFEHSAGLTGSLFRALPGRYPDIWQRQPDGSWEGGIGLAIGT